MNYSVRKKDGTLEPFNIEKVIVAIGKSAERVMVIFTEEEINKICNIVTTKVQDLNTNTIDISTMHFIVESALEEVKPEVAKSYRDYRNYKVDFVHMLDKVYQNGQKIRYLGDKSNANTDSSLVSTQRSLIYSELNSELYKKFFLNAEERQAMKEGYIYIHDRSARLDTMNCCLFDMATVVKMDLKWEMYGIMNQKL